MTIPVAPTGGIDWATDSNELCNQLRAHLRIVFPGAVGLFFDLDSPISLRFLTRFPTAQKADWLSIKRLGARLAANGYPGRAKTPMLLDPLTHTPAGHSGDAGDATLAYVTTLQPICQQIRTLEADIAEQLALHPDAHIFRSLPRCQTIRAAKLLVQIGGARGRFPTDASLAALAGACPSPRQSGRHHVVACRWACDNKLRAALMDFAGDSRKASPWAGATYNRHIADNKTHQHAPVSSPAPGCA